MSETFADAPKVSVIVPVYNVEKYLDKCVRSLVDQELRDIEIILVDDGSPDACPAMCDEWAQRDSRIRVVHKENGGLSDARNAGVAAARAPYVGFVDSDDYVAPSMYRVLYENIVHDGADVAICGVYSCYADRVVAPDSDDRFVLTGREAVKEILGGRRLRVWVPPKLYARSIMLETPFLVGRTYEDAFAVVDIFSRVSRVSVDLHPQYYYWHREGTITSQPFNAKAMDIVDAYEHCYDMVSMLCPEALPEAEFRLYWSRFTVLDKMLLDDSAKVFSQQEEVVRYLRKHWRDILSNPYVGKGRKLAMLALKVNVRLYRACAKSNASRYGMN